MSKEFTMSETEVLTRWANFPLDALGPFDRETLKLAASLLEQRQSARDAALEAVREFARSILHGDEKHRQWLLDEAEKFIALKRSSPPAPDGAPCERCSRAHPKEGWAYNWASGECFELADWAKPAPPAPDKQAAPTAECRLCGQTHWRPWTQSGFCPYMMS